MARAALNWTVRDLAEMAGLHRNTINNFETGRFAGDAATLEKIERVLAAVGVEFIDENGGGPGVRLQKGGGNRPFARNANGGVGPVAMPQQKCSSSEGNLAPS